MSPGRSHRSRRPARACRLLAPLLAILLLPAGCADRRETARDTPDSTRVYPGKNPEDVNVTITFCESYDRDTGERFGVKRAFMMDEGAWVRAFVDIDNRFARGDRELSFHLVWVGPNGKDIYKKRIEYTPSDADTSLYSSMSISPDNRNMGRYTLQVYLFRELIAEKSFDLI
ncbi:MAG: hypothetical protein GF355_11290 [Candidatus Eisenbacteria bacterium]|nr:hypothetical protein [Candidatus Eisenbacteria bacterium]